MRSSCRRRTHDDAVGTVFFCRLPRRLGRGLSVAVLDGELPGNTRQVIMNALGGCSNRGPIPRNTTSVEPRSYGITRRIRTYIARWAERRLPTGSAVPAARPR